nr:MAG TPA: hypothetical protein [Caudoviricetes sp.]
MPTMKKVIRKANLFYSGYIYILAHIYLNFFIISFSLNKLNCLMPLSPLLRSP